MKKICGKAMQKKGNLIPPPPLMPTRGITTGYDAHWGYWGGFFGSITAIIGCELRLQLRTLTFWLVLVIGCGAMGLECWFLASPSGVSHDGGSVAVVASPFVENFVLLLLPFLFLNTFARDRQRKVYAIIWTRPVASLTYALGKGLAAIVISVVLSLVIQVCGWATIEIIWHTLLPLVPWFSLFPLFAISNTLVALFTLFAISLMPVPFIGVLLSVGAITYFALLRLKTMLLLPNLTAATIFYSPSIGFGPDEALLQTQLLCILLTALLCMGLFLFVFQTRERNGIIYPRHWISVAVLLILSGGLLLPTVGDFQSLAATYNDLGPLPAQSLAASTSHYRLAVTADPNTGSMNGNASFVLTPTSSSGKELSLALSVGLHVEQIRASTPQENPAPTDGVPLAFRSALGWTTVSLEHTPYAQRLPVQLSISYAGQLTTNRNYYAKAAAGLIEPVANVSGEVAELLSYLGQGVGFLKGNSGYWYPLLWTTQTENSDRVRPAIDEVRLRLPTTIQVFSSLAVHKRTINGQWQELIVQPHRSLPLAFVAALSSPQQITFGNTPIFCHGSTPDRDKLRYYQALTRQVETLDHWLRAPTMTVPHWNTVIVPLLQAPLVGPGLLLVPEQLNNWEKEAAHAGTDTAVSFLAGEEVGWAWWLTTLPSHVQVFTVPKGVEPQQSHDHAVLAFGTDWLYSMLTDYSAAFLTERIVGHDFLAQKQSLCQQREHWTNEQRLSVQVLGIKSIYCTFNLLDHLERHDGADKVTALLQQFIIHHSQEPTNLAMFLTEASAMLGRNLTVEAKPYICVGIDANNLSCSVGD